MKYCLIAIFLIPFYCIGQAGYSFKQFSGTPVEPLARMIQKGKLGHLNKLVKTKRFDLNYKESKYGHTLLMLSVMNNKKNVVEILLKNGADPNVRNNTYQTVLMLHADGISADYCDTEVTQLLIKYGANINDTCNYIDSVKYILYQHTPFIKACQGACEAKIKLLISNGANINQWVGNEGNCAITRALIHGRMDVLKYLIIDMKAKIPPFCLVTLNGDTISILGLLRKSFFSIGSKEHKIKMEIVKYLKDKYGLDYFLEPLPKGFHLERMKREHPYDFEEYIKMY